MFETLRASVPFLCMNHKGPSERRHGAHAAKGKAPQGHGLHYASDDKPGITRRRYGKGWVYRAPDGTRLTDAATIERIGKIGIPPAYKNVWICPRANGHIQATGRDAKGRKQYAYHPRFREKKESGKYAHILTFARVLPAIRNRVNFDLRRRGLPREKVLAVIVRLLDMTMIRIGNADYEKQNGSYGLTTLHRRHLLIQGNELRFRFRGKAAKQWNLTLRDQRMARVLEAIRQLPGRRLFQYAATDGRNCALTSTAVNAYLRDISGTDVTAKDFRTWHGTVLAAVKLAALGHRDHETATKKSIGDVIGQVAARLGNTPAVCRRCYIHPQVIASYLAGELNLDAPRQNTKSEGRLGADEARVLAFLQDHTNDRREA